MKRISALNLSKYVTLRYIIALTLVASLSTTSFFVIGGIVSKQKDDAAAINISGRQRLLVERIAYNSLMLVNEITEEGVEGIKKKIQNDVDLLESSHANLLFGNKEAGLDKLISPPLINIFYNYPIFLDRQIKTYIHHTTQLLKSNKSGLTPHNEHFTYIKANANAELQDGIDKAVKQFEVDNENAIKSFVDFENIIVLFSISLLIFQAFFIYRPMVKKVYDTNSELERANQLKSHFLKNINHELRTPLNSIFGSAELILEAPLKPSQEQHVYRLMNAADLLMNKIEDLIEVSNLTHGDFKLANVSFDIKSLIDSVIEVYSIKASHHNLEMIVNYPDNLPRYFIGDPRRIRQVLNNLLDNAIKFTPQGHIFLKVNLMKNEIKNAPDLYELYIEVEDTGIGMPTQKIKHLFDRFNHVPNQPTTSDNGIGLAISQKVIELMGGKLNVESVEKTGTKFWFTARLFKSEKNTETNVKWEILKNVRTLIVDDVELNRDLLSERLRSIGMVCDTAESGEVAISKLNKANAENHPYQLAIVDYLMPNMNGKALTKLIKSNKMLADLPIVILSSAGEQGYEKIFQDAGASGFMSKPIKTKSLLDLLSVVWSKALAGDISHTALSDINNYVPIKVKDYEFIQDKKILLVEDNKFCQEITKEMIQDLGCQLDIAANGQEALDYIDKREYDLILMDCQMPVMDGFEATRRIRAKLVDTPIVALTANILTDDLKRIQDCGMNDCLAKPIRKEAFVAWLVNFFNAKNVANENNQEIYKTLVNNGYASNPY